MAATKYLEQFSELFNGSGSKDARDDIALCEKLIADISRDNHPSTPFLVQLLIEIDEYKQCLIANNDLCPRCYARLDYVESDVKIMKNGILTRESMRKESCSKCAYSNEYEI